MVLFTKGGGLWLDIQADSEADALGLDWTMPIDRARQVLTESQRQLTKQHKKLQSSKAIQGNLDPATLYGSPATIRSEVNAMLDSAYANGEKTGYVANLGHGITQWVNPDNAKVFIDAVHDYKI